MNTYLTLILAFLIGNYLLNLMARVCNLRSLSLGLPEEFRDSMDAGKYQRSQEYSHLTPHPLVVFLRYSHPPVLARIRAIRRGVW